MGDTGCWGQAVCTACHLTTLIGRWARPCAPAADAPHGVAVSPAALTAVAQELEVVHWFPDHPTTEFFPGKSVSCVIGVRNSGASTLNITAAAASLNSPYNATMNLYNFTAQVRSRRCRLHC